MLLTPIHAPVPGGCIANCMSDQHRAAAYVYLCRVSGGGEQCLGHQNEHITTSRCTAAMHGTACILQVRQVYEAHSC